MAGSYEDGNISLESVEGRDVCNWLSNCEILEE